MRWPVTTCLALTAVLGGCGGSTEPTVGALLIGGGGPGGEGFVDLVDGQDVALVPGAQGGFHVWINVSVHGVTGPLSLEHTARRVRDDALILRGIRQRLEVPGDAMDGWWQAPSASPAFMCPSPIGVQVFDEEVLFTVRLLDADGALLAEDLLTLVPRCPPGDDFCVEICAG